VDGSASLAGSTPVDINNRNETLETGLDDLKSQLKNAYQTLADGRKIFIPELEALGQLAKDNGLNLDLLLKKITLSETGHVVKAVFAPLLNLKDIQAISGLTSLTSLNMGGCLVSDISPLGCLTSLTWLNLENNQIIDPTALSGLTSLTSLSIGGNQISDISALTGLTGLNRLELFNNPLSEAANEIVEMIRNNAVEVHR